MIHPAAELVNDERHLFYVWVDLANSEQHRIGYDSIHGCLTDRKLRELFDLELVESCSVHCESLRVTALPVMSWERFVDHLVSNGQLILRAMARRVV